jgi:predicted ribosomally synthesized peptide with SipW-like signal peptide
MKKILISLMTIAMVGALVGGGVFAYFSDVETSTGNTFTAGTLNLVPATSGTGPVGKYTPTAGGDGINGNVVFTTLAPADSGTITWTLTNNGNLAGTLTIASTATFSDVSANEPENAVTVPHANNAGTGEFTLGGDLDEFVGVKLQRGVGTDQATAIAAFAYILGGADYYATFSDLEAVLDAQSQAMAADSGNDTIVYRLTWNIASDILGPGPNGTLGEATGNDDVAADDNIIQSDSATVDITFTLTQS